MIAPATWPCDWVNAQHSTDDVVDTLPDKAEIFDREIWAKVAPPFRVVGCKFCFVKMRYRRVAKARSGSCHYFAFQLLDGAT